MTVESALVDFRIACRKLRHDTGLDKYRSRGLISLAATSLLPEEISRLLSPLDEREREILKLRFGLDRGEPRTLEEVGEHFNLTRERIRQIENQSLKKLQSLAEAQKLRDVA